MAGMWTTKRKLRRRRRLQPKHMIALLPLVVPIGSASSHDASRHTISVIADSTNGRENPESGKRSTPQDPHTGGGDEVILPSDPSSASIECFKTESTCSADPGPGFRSLGQSSVVTAQDASGLDIVPALNSRVRDDERKPSTAASAVERSSPSVPASLPASASQSPPSRLDQATSSSSVSAVLVVTLQDAHLATLLMTTLRACGAMDIFQDFFVVVPGEELVQVEAMLSNSSSDDERFGKGSSQHRELIMVDEKQLLLAAGVGKVEARWSTYSLQMALKLLAWSLMQTPFYLTLDADVLCAKDQLSEQDLLPQSKGNYLPEGRAVHPSWWSSSARALQVEENPKGGGFGVTPAVLSTAGAKLTLGRLREVHGNDDGFLGRVFDLWVGDPDWRWSEYTLYRTALDHFDAFEALHAVGTTKLLGDESVWYSEQFEAWNATAAFDESAAGFVVVQSTARIGVAKMLKKLEEGLEGEGVLTPSGSSAPSLLERIVRQMGGS